MATCLALSSGPSPFKRGSGKVRLTSVIHYYYYSNNARKNSRNQNREFTSQWFPIPFMMVKKMVLSMTVFDLSMKL